MLLEQVEQLKFSGIRGSNNIVAVDGRPLIDLCESAFLGARVYELMTIQRPGDIQHYLQVGLLDISDRTKYKLTNDEIDRYVINGIEYMSFVDFDSHFHWWGWDNEAEDENWILLRKSNSWRHRVQILFDTIAEVQQQLKNTNDLATKNEIGLISAGKHVLDFEPEIDRKYRYSKPANENQLADEDLYKLLTHLFKRENAHSVSCDINDFQLWRMLVGEQIKRSKESRVPPQKAFTLCAPELTKIELAAQAEYWGGEVHESMQGFMPGDICVNVGQVYPPRYSAELDRLIVTWTGGHCQYFISQTDHGKIERTKKSKHGNWIMYESLSKYRPAITDQLDDREIPKATPNQE